MDIGIVSVLVLMLSEDIMLDVIMMLSGLMLLISGLAGGLENGG